MEENKERDVQTEDISVQKRTRAFLCDVLAGACIGVAFIIPGFSGGSVAAILGIYEKMINAIANIFKELNGEKIDVVPYSDDPCEYIKAALSPANVKSVEMISDRSARVIVAPDQLSLAIGKMGQNARLAARLTGFKIDIKSE